MDSPKKISDMPEYLTPQDNEFVKLTQSGYWWNISASIFFKNPSEMTDDELLENYRQL